MINLESKSPLGDLSFINHLYDDKYLPQDYLLRILFINHLYDDKLRIFNSLSIFFFINHLYDDKLL